MPFCKFVQTYKMQRLLLIIFASFFLCISCKKSAPKGVLSHSKMADLLVEVHLIDGYLNGLQIDSSRKVIDDLYGQAFKKIGIDSLLFKQNMDYYLGNPVEAKLVYAEVSKRLMAMEQTYNVEDSIQNAVFTDSLMRVQRFVKLKDEAEKLILHVSKDELPLDYKNSGEDFMRRAGLTLNIYGQNIPLQKPVIEEAVGTPEAAVEGPETLIEEPSSSAPDTVSSVRKAPRGPSNVLRR